MSLSGSTADRPAGPALAFGLVHGGAHGAWCWRRVIEALGLAGHRGIAMDLPCEDERAGALEYAAVVVDALAEVEGPVVLVGHSLGGLTVPLVAAARPVSRLIFLAALLPVPGKSLREQQAAEPDMLFPYSGGRPGLRQRFFNTCTPEDADWGMSRIRVQALTPFTETTPLEEWPAVPSSYVLCTEDRACNPAWSRRAARERLGVEAVEIEGSGHSPFLDRPAALAELLVELARS
jgi:pimeloyl-ACP methyl ester carboxylesterase